MQYRRFGRTELSMPVLSCGGMRYQQSWQAGAPVSAESQRNLEATIDRALALGIDHIETARGYGTSEAQLGVALARLPRTAFKLQSKVAPTDDPRTFEKNLNETFERLRVDYLDLFAFHGLNNRDSFDKAMRPGGCFDIVDRHRRAGRIRHVGFSTHAHCPLIVEAIETGRFDYVNLHYYYIFQDNRPALEAARRQDMGVFIISPSDKGGRLYDPTPRLVELCAPLSPMAFNDLFTLSDPRVHTLSIGAARPTDFDEHTRAVDRLAEASDLVAPVVERLARAYREANGDSYARTWQDGLPEWEDVPGHINVKLILSLLNLVKAYGMLRFARDRYSLLTGHDHWVPGAQAASFADDELKLALARSPHRDAIPGLLREAHALLG